LAYVPQHLIVGENEPRFRKGQKQRKNTPHGPRKPSPKCLEKQRQSGERSPCALRISSAHFTSFLE